MLLVTGATGFIGSAVIDGLAERRVRTRASMRRTDGPIPPGVERSVVDGLSADTDWTAAVSGVSAVVHTAARVHVMQDNARDPLAEFRRTNVEGTLHLADSCAAAGVSRFVFVSSIKVNGELTRPGRPFLADDEPAPVDPYGVSKMEAERGLREIAARTGMDVVIIRPPLVYGPGVKANFRSMMKWVACGIPLPLGAIDNARSLVAIDNLVDLIVTCIDHPAAANQTFLVSDNEDLSTTALLTRMANALGRDGRLIPLPAAVLSAIASLLGKQDVVQRVCGSLQVDITKTRDMLGWSPCISVDAALKKTAEGYLREALG